MHAAAKREHGGEEVDVGDGGRGVGLMGRIDQVRSVKGSDELTLRVYTESETVVWFACRAVRVYCVTGETGSGTLRIVRSTVTWYVV